MVPPLDTAKIPSFNWHASTDKAKLDHVSLMREGQCFNLKNFCDLC